MSTINYLFILPFLLWACSCQSQPQQSIDLYNPHPEINSSNLVDSVVAHIQSYPQEPVYFIFAHNSLCYYEILVNDMPVYKKFKQETVATPIVINMGITQSGEQKLTYRLYPYGNTFGENANFDITMEVMDKRIGMSSSREILSHEASHTEMRGSNQNIAMKIFDGEGLTYYEHTLTFRAQVPYHIEGWTTGQDLRKLNQDTLYQAVMDYYKNYKKIYETQDADLLAGLNYESLIETSQEEYEAREKVERIWNEHNDDLRATDKDFFPMENSPMAFYGDGRIVALHIVLDEVRFTHWSALMFKYNDEGDISVNNIGLYLYLPKGEKDLRKFKLAF